MISVFTALTVKFVKIYINFMQFNCLVWLTWYGNTLITTSFSGGTLQATLPKPHAPLLKKG